MSDDTNIPEADDNSAIKQMRGALERKDETIAERDQQIAAMRSQLVGGHLQNIGLDPSTGLGKAIAKEYDGDVTAEAVAAFAMSEYGHEPQAPQPVMQEPPVAQQQFDQQQQAAAFGSASGSIAPTTPEDVIGAHDQRLGSQEATRQDALNSLEAKVQHYPVFHPSE